MKVLHVICSDRFAGVERHVALLAQAQHDAGHMIAVAGGDQVAMRRAIDRAAVRVHPSGTLVTAVRSAHRLAAWADVVHAHMTASEIAAAAAVATSRVPLVSTRHFSRKRGSHRLNRLVAATAGLRIDAQIAVSDYAARQIEGRSTVIHAGVPDRAEPPVDARTMTVLVAQRLEPEKQTVRAVEIFAASRAARSGWLLHIAGSGAEQPLVEQRVCELGLEGSTTMLGFRDDVDALMASAGVLLAPCPVDSFGLSVVEAMAQGLPVVAAGAGGHLETVGSVEDPALYDPEDAEAGGAVLAALVADADGRAAYGKRLRTAQRTHFTLEAQERATAAVYRSVL